MPRATPAQIAAVQAHIDAVRAAYDNNTDAPWTLDHDVVRASYEAIAACAIHPTEDPRIVITSKDVEDEFLLVDGVEFEALQDTLTDMIEGEPVIIDAYRE